LFIKPLLQLGKATSLLNGVFQGQRRIQANPAAALHRATYTNRQPGDIFALPRFPMGTRREESKP
jgi:hypothetical protein